MYPLSRSGSPVPGACMNTGIVVPGVQSRMGLSETLTSGGGGGGGGGGGSADTVTNPAYAVEVVNSRANNSLKVLIFVTRVGMDKSDADSPMADCCLQAK